MDILLRPLRLPMIAIIGTENLHACLQRFLEQRNGFMAAVNLTVRNTFTCLRKRYVSVSVTKMRMKKAESMIVKVDGTFKVVGGRAKYAHVCDESTYTSDTANHRGCD